MVPTGSAIRPWPSGKIMAANSANTRDGSGSCEIHLGVGAWIRLLDTLTELDGLAVAIIEAAHGSRHFTNIYKLPAIQLGRPVAGFAFRTSAVTFSHRMHRQHAEAARCILQRAYPSRVVVLCLSFHVIRSVLSLAARELPSEKWNRASCSRSIR
jgi:hypothetical protein